MSERRRKGEKAARGRKSKANERSSDFLMTGPLYVIEARKEKLIATFLRIGPLKDMRTLHLHFTSYRRANQSHAFVFYVDGCAYLRPDIRGNSRVEYIYNFKHKASFWTKNKN